MVLFSSQTIRVVDNLYNMRNVGLQNIDSQFTGYFSPSMCIFVYRNTSVLCSFHLLSVFDAVKSQVQVHAIVYFMIAECVY